ncbi:MAG TPA: hypothetical protein VG458_09400 [Solirubrobacterales bacterium]|nr:hypothetical protein [Solirubrobacterales bacterium]
MPIPSALQVTVAYLNTVEAVQDANARVLSGTPTKRGDPWLRVTLLADPSTDGGEADHLIAAFLQIDVFAGESNNTALAVDNLSIAVREALRVMKHAEHEGAVVTGAESSRTHMPETNEEPAMERFQISATIWLHG